MAEKYIFLDNDGVLSEKEATITSSGNTEAGKIVALDNTGKLDITLMPVGIGADTEILPASENLSAGDFISIFDDNGTTKVRLADASAASKQADGYVLSSVTAGNNALIYFGRKNNQLSSLIKGARYYLSASNPGKITTTPPNTANSIVQYLGVAISTTTLAFEPGIPVKRA